MHLKEPKAFIERGSNPRFGLVRKEEGKWERKVPVRVKDVAGLVQGAYKGRGRGNAFLNDLCDADVLIHVVDASGRTDGGGNKIDGSGGALYDVSKDVEWVSQEIHRWIFENVRRKWKTILRDPTHLPKMFTGWLFSFIFAFIFYLGVNSFFVLVCSFFI